MVTGRLFNVINFIAIFLLSLGLYYGYSWVSNYLNFSKTLLTSEELHESPIFYLTVFMCSGTVLIFELFVETIRVNLRGSPTQLARKEVNSGRISVWFEQEFERLRRIREIGFVKQDIKKEKWIVKKRERRMKKMEERIKNEEEQKAQKLAAKKNAEAQKSQNSNQNTPIVNSTEHLKAGKQLYHQDIIKNSEGEAEDEEEEEESEEEDNS